MFVPLHLYSEYSFLESGILLENAFKKAQELGYQSIGLSDHNILMAYPLFNKLAKKYKMHPIFGMDLDIENCHYSLFIKNEEGYKNLCKISTMISTREITLVNLKSFISGLLVVISSSSLIFSNINKDFKNTLADIAKNFNPDDFYIGLDFVDKNSQNHYELIRNFVDEFCYQSIAFPHIKYVNKEDAISLDILQAIKSQTTLDKSYETKNNFNNFKSSEELKELFNEKEIEDTQIFISKIDFDFDKKRGEMLHFPVNNGETSATALKNKILEGLEFRHIDLKNNPKYRARLNYEYLTIDKMGYCDYFLIVQDYVNFAKHNDIPVGPGRGSAAGSLVSYLLNITEVDPLKYNLLFERFLNPQRQTMPDIDMDFSDVKREQVIAYLKNKYGSDRVANVVTIQTIGAKQALRDVGRVYGLSNGDVTLLTKLIVEKNNFMFKLDEAYKTFPNFRKEIDSDSSFKLVFEKAKLIEGLGRQRGLNAAGMVLNNVALDGNIPLIEDENGLITQYEKDYLEDEGFLKMDILGLINLSMIDNCLKLIKKEHNINLDIKTINLDDSKIYELIDKNLTMGLFQLDTGAASNALKQFKPRNFNELAAFISLDRPGPRVNLPSYARRNKGQEKVTYLDSSLKASLEDTYGIMIYQEQIMLVSQAFAGFSFAEADLLRRACAKKHKNEMDELKNKFVIGARKKGHNDAIIERVYDTIARFAEYGFNKSHAVAYAMITAQTGYLKAYYPTEFYSSILESQYSKNDLKFSKYVNEIKKSNVEISNPDINKSGYSFTVNQGKLIMPLTSINGIFFKFIKQIIDERDANGDYKDYLDFIIRNYKIDKNISDNQVAKLIDAGCFDNLNKNRKSLKQAFSFAIIYAKNNADNALNLDSDFTFKYPDVIDDPFERIDNEYQVLGVMLSDSPLNHVKDKLSKYKLTDISDLKENQIATIAGIYRSVKKINTKNNKTMAFITIYDNVQDLDITLFSDTYEKYVDLINTLSKNDIVIIKGKMSRNYKTNELGFVLDEISKLS